ncbi:chitobiase/beta-hexosaminidase C-terminal domain-containing protein [Myxococcus sp. Y35]|uniref:chitobiase/beta-hexosaminidase C-terminal domain-containing protein n=1 Tax=Pseudomyxococcus flavus TaxID=3115648 RepID=UPI003CEB2CE1
MRSISSWPLRYAALALTTQLVLACGGGGGGEPQPPPAADLTPPTTRATPDGGDFSGAVVVTLACDDGQGSGCAATYYTLDGSTPGTGSTQYREPFTLGSTTTVRFYSVDTAGNAEAPKSVTYTLAGAPDVEPPATVANPASGSFSSPRSVALTCDDGAGSGCAATYYTLDGSVPTQASPRYTAPLSIAASVTLRFFSVDRVGNIEAVRQARYVVDTEAPQVAATPRGGTFTTTRVVTLACDDGDGAGCAAIHYTTNDAIPSLESPVYGEPLVLTATTRVRFIAVDWAGNVSEVVSELYTRDAPPEDREAPATVANPAGGIYRSAQSVVLACADHVGGSGCAATYYTLDGSAPTTSSPRYTGAISVSATSTLRFFSVDQAGNAEAAKSEQYTVDTVAPVTTATPAGGSYTEAVTVTLTCSDSGTGCRETRYTLDGSAPETGSPLYTAPFTLSASATLRFASVDQAGNVEQPKQESYSILSMDAVASTQIQAVRDAAEGPVALVINGARITYVKAAVGNAVNDPAGFFLQAEQAGPALFVAVDPDTLSPRPQAGARVRVTVSQKSVVNGQARAASLSSYSVLSLGHSLSDLVQDVSGVDVTEGDPPRYESQYISITGTLGGTGFSNAGLGHVQAPLTTAGVPEGSGAAAYLRLRVVEPLHELLSLTPGCSVTVVSPLWLYRAAGQVRHTLQPSVWTEAQVTASACPAPRVVSAQATDRNSVMVRFSRPLDEASVDRSGSQFTIPGLSVTGALALGHGEVWLSTGNQAPRQPYSVTVARTVRDVRGTPVDAAAASATFSGFQRPAQLRITEIAPNVAMGRDLVELYVVQGGTTLGALLVDGNSVGSPLATLPEVEVSTGDFIVIHLNPDRTTPGTDAPASETLGKSQYSQSVYSSNFDTAWDFQGGSVGLGTGNRTLRILDGLGFTQDAVAATVVGNTFAGYPALLQSIQDLGQWLPSNCGGIPCTYTSYPSAWDVSVDWSQAFHVQTRDTTVQRFGMADTDTREDWGVGPASFGAPNP